jgi:hypothetical protein
MKCEKCSKESTKLTPVLMMGKNGFRRYKICPACQDNTQKPKVPAGQAGGKHAEERR